MAIKLYEVCSDEIEDDPEKLDLDDIEQARKDVLVADHSGQRIVQAAADELPDRAGAVLSTAKHALALQTCRK